MSHPTLSTIVTCHIPLTSSSHGNLFAAPSPCALLDYNISVAIETGQHQQ